MTRRPPVRVDAVGAPGSFALLTAEDFTDYLDLMGPTWRNEVCARSLLGLPFNRAVLRADRISCPTLFVVAEQDSIAPPAAATNATFPSSRLIVFLSQFENFWLFRSS